MRAFALAASIVLACVPSTPGTTARSLSPTPATTSAAAIPSATSTPTASPTPTVARTQTATVGAGSVRYASTELGYSLDLPAGWRRAVCSPGAMSVNPINATEFFVGVPEAEEQIVGGAQMLVVQVVQSEGRTAEAYLQNTASQPDVKFERVTLNGRDAARAYVATGNVTYAYAVAARGWLYRVERPYFGTDDDATRRIIATFRVLDDATLGRGPAASPAPRSAEVLADALTAAFATKDIAAIAETMEPCVTVAAVPGDGGAISRVRYLNDVAAQFAAGTSVKVMARPIEDGPYGRFVRATWSKPGDKDLRADFLVRARGDRWSVTGVLYRLTP